MQTNPTPHHHTAVLLYRYQRCATHDWHEMQDVTLTFTRGNKKCGLGTSSIGGWDSTVQRFRDGFFHLNAKMGQGPKFIVDSWWCLNLEIHRSFQYQECLVHFNFRCPHIIWLVGHLIDFHKPGSLESWDSDLAGLRSDFMSVCFWNWCVAVWALTFIARRVTLLHTLEKFTTTLLILFTKLIAIANLLTIRKKS